MTSTEMPCPHCNGTGKVEDPIVRLMKMNAAEDEFCAAYPRMSCPSCRKRMSPRFDAVNSRDPAATEIQMVCHHCEHRFTVPRHPGSD